jgi:hypothetical protein
VFRRARILSTLAAGLAVAGPARADPKAPAEAQPFSASLDYIAPPACPTSADFQGVVVRRLGFDPFSSKARRRVLVSIFTREQGLEGRLEWLNEAGKWAGDQTFQVRTLECGELVRAMGLALAVQIHLLTIEGPPPAEREEPPAMAGSPSKEGPAAPSPGAAPALSSNVTARRQNESNDTGANASSGQRWAFEFGVGSSLGVGLLPHPVALGRAFGAASWGPASLELAGELSTLAGADRADGAGFNVHEWLLSAAFCGTRGPLSACLLAKGGGLSVSGTRIDVPASPSGKTVLTGVRLGVREHVARSIFLAQCVEGLVNLTRWTVTLDGVPVWTAPVVAATLGVDVGVIFE